MKKIVIPAILAGASPIRCRVFLIQNVGTKYFGNRLIGTNGTAGISGMTGLI